MGVMVTPRMAEMRVMSAVSMSRPKDEMVTMMGGMAMMMMPPPTAGLGESADSRENRHTRKHCDAESFREARVSLGAEGRHFTFPLPYYTGATAYCSQGKRRQNITLDKIT
jgi:hypothetical protein